MLLEGQLFKQYHIVRQLKSGGMGEVYLANDVHLHRQVAIKVIRNDASHYADVDAFDDAARLFLREARAIAQLEHNRILPLYSVDEEDINGIPHMYMVMPFRRRGSLADWLYKHNQRTLPPGDVERIVKQAASALQHAHDHQIIHQDVKPSNFLILADTEQPDQLNLQLADFGVAKFMTTTSESQTIRGTPTYMAPEQWEGHPVPATDQYALAVMAYELLTGRPPFVGSNYQQIWHQHYYADPRSPSTLNASIPQDVDDVLLRALAKNPDDRFDSISTFARAFRQALSESCNIHQTLTIRPSEARLGTSRVLFLSGRRQVTVYVPPGTYDGQVIRLEGQGKHANDGGPPGALILTIRINAMSEVESLSDATTVEQTLPMLDVDDTSLNTPHKRGFRRETLLLLGLVLLLITGSFISALFIMRTNQQKKPNLTATAVNNGKNISSTRMAIAAANGTATAQGNATSTAQTNATATAQTNATATAQANATATAQANAAAQA